MNIIRATEIALYNASGLLNEYTMNLLFVFVFGAGMLLGLMWLCSWFERNIQLDGFTLMVVVSGVVLARIYFYTGSVPNLTF